MQLNFKPLRITDIHTEPDYSIKREIFINDHWVKFDSYGDNTKESREFYSKMTIVGSGSVPIRYNGVVNPNSPENSVFYRSNN